MNFSQEWDDCYNLGGQAISWPWSDLIGFVMRYARPTHSGYKVLELGCGTGANIAFFQKLGCQYYGIDGSEFVVEQTVRAYPELRGRIVQGDFTVDLPFACDYDLIVDRASLSHNTAATIRRGLDLAYRKLRSGGVYIGIDWFSTLHTDYRRGSPAEDEYTRTGYVSGLFAGLGRVHFSDKEHLLDLFSPFEVTVLEHKLVQGLIPNDGRQIATWNLVARKG